MTCGLLKSTGITSAYSALTRGQAAKLFLNLFEAKPGKGEAPVFQYNVGKTEVYLTNLDGGKGTMTAGGQVYNMAHPVTSTSLMGSKGKVVLNGSGEILTFLPVTGGSGISNAAVIIGANGSALGLDSLTGGGSYTIYKNGTPASGADLKKYDVATYSSATNAVIVCDTRVSVYYEDCTPSPSNPTTITVLGGTKLNVLPSAVESLSQFKPGQQMILLLTADGQVAGAIKSGASGNALAVVDGSGAVQLICGSSLLKLNGSGAGYENSVVNVSGVKEGKDVKLSLRAASGRVSGDLDVQKRMLGSKKLAENVMIFDGGKQVALGELSQSGIRANRIAYARSNWADEVDLIVLNNGLSGQEIFGRAVVKVTRDEEGKETSRTIAVEYGNGEATKDIENANSVSNGAYIVVTLTKDGNRFASFDTMSKLGSVADSAWIGKTAVNYSGRTYEVASDVLCYNADTGRWLEDLDAARNYGGTMTLYAYEGVIRIVEVKA